MFLWRPMWKTTPRWPKCRFTARNAGALLKPAALRLCFHGCLDGFLKVYESMRWMVKAVNPGRANVILYVVRLILTVALFAICCWRHGVFFSGIDYSGHSICGWIGLWFTCAWAACIIGTTVLWLLKITPRRKPNWEYFTFAIAFLILFASGLSRHVPNPIIGEIGVGAAATLLLYVSFFSENS